MSAGNTPGLCGHCRHGARASRGCCWSRGSMHGWRLLSAHPSEFKFSLHVSEFFPSPLQLNKGHKYHLMTA